MKKRLLTIFLFVLTASASSCGGGSSVWTALSYNVTADATLSDVMADMTELSGVSFSLDEDLQSQLDEESFDLPILSGLTAGEVLALLQDMMPSESSYVYAEQSDGSIVLKLRYEEADDLTEADPVNIIEYDDGLGAVVSNLISDPEFDEECGGEVGNILDFLGSGETFDIVTEVVSDPSGHSEFIGVFPSSVELEIDGNAAVITGDSPWVQVSGSIDEDGLLTCSGSGIVAGYPDVSVIFDGEATGDGLSGTLTVGAGGELPGGDPAIYSVSP